MLGVIGQLSIMTTTDSFKSAIIRRVSSMVCSLPSVVIYFPPKGNPRTDYIRLQVFEAKNCRGS